MMRLFAVLPRDVMKVSFPVSTPSVRLTHLGPVALEFDSLVSCFIFQPMRRRRINGFAWRHGASSFNMVSGSSVFGFASHVPC